MVIIQENRSFDNFFHGFPGADSATSGAYSHHGTVTLMPVALDSHATTSDTSTNRSPPSTTVGVWTASISVVIYAHHRECIRRRGQLFPYGYVPQGQIAPYWTLASQYVLADRTFQSNSGPSYPAHQYLIAGQSDNIPDGPSKSPLGLRRPARNDGVTDYAKRPSPGAISVLFVRHARKRAGRKGTRLAVLCSPHPRAGWSVQRVRCDPRHHFHYGPDWHRKVLRAPRRAHSRTSPPDS